MVYMIGPTRQDWSKYSKRGLCKGGQRVRGGGGITEGGGFGDYSVLINCLFIVA